jgi:hypothetical protein
MAAYILRNIDPELWAKVKRRAAGEGRGLRWVILTLIEYYAEKGLPRAVAEKAEKGNQS